MQSYDGHCLRPVLARSKAQVRVGLKGILAQLADGVKAIAKRLPPNLLANAAVKRGSSYFTSLPILLSNGQQKPSTSHSFNSIQIPYPRQSSPWALPFINCHAPSGFQGGILPDNDVVPMWAFSGRFLPLSLRSGTWISSQALHENSRMVLMVLPGETLRKVTQ